VIQEPLMKSSIYYEFEILNFAYPN
jgi:hypothetical protein